MASTQSAVLRFSLDEIIGISLSEIEGAAGELSSSNDTPRTCLRCGTQSTPKWRRGGSLCNACGLRDNNWRRTRRIALETSESRLENIAYCCGYQRRASLPHALPGLSGRLLIERCSGCCERASAVAADFTNYAVWWGSPADIGLGIEHAVVGNRLKDP
ncbi:hypothetical protein EMIHUDRAFT_224905 [Emiliania huxleyi CCMP1516]|uniref:GATA-type domain-containing protein n=2 Tax=Emiliania huxleyi TaxID=2903 RepID=A0A0D3KQ85_EMIH1|nr:hypothetical protein EMIHUDRAFT_224905 [Emiliania huxleyi CCMP1516]EOD37920.1 hypothetical protein EMIHUDRAFT_224905 [Emiliania huxleyi CCMP1516]|eukprot:XP_005790349.1 hypothetical protein EMIHUDRAFT_224905 [Emiliania huxleyi CCMP1516]